MTDQPTDAGRVTDADYAMAHDLMTDNVSVRLSDEDYGNLGLAIAQALGAAREHPIRMVSGVLSDCAPDVPMPSCETGTLAEWEAALRAAFKHVRAEGARQERERHQRLVDAVGAFLASRHWEGTHTSDMGTAELWRAIDDLRAREPREEPSR